MENFDVVVVGSCMIDLICYTSRMPKVGETIHGNNFEIGHGGKGANQCVAAAKLGAKTALIAKVGDDHFGRNYVKSLKSEGVNVDFTYIKEHQKSGMAQITVAENGDNVIVIVAGANNTLSFDDVKNAKDIILNSKIVLFQLETPLETTMQTLKFIKDNGGPTTFVNGAPALKNLDTKLLKLCDIFCVNESEAAAITNMEVTDVKSGKEAVQKMIKLGCKMVILTLGAQGVLFTSGSIIQHVSTEKVKPIDTTGAGDCFVGAFCFYKSKYPNLSLEEVVKRSAFIATQSVLKKGTQSSYPLKNDLPKHLF